MLTVCHEKESLLMELTVDTASHKKNYCWFTVNHCRVTVSHTIYIHCLSLLSTRELVLFTEEILLVTGSYRRHCWVTVRYSRVTVRYGRVTANNESSKFGSLLATGASLQITVCHGECQCFHCQSCNSFSGNS